MGHFSHDKGERYVLGRLVELMAFNNRDYKLNPSWHDGIISVQIDANSVHSNDNDITTNMMVLWLASTATEDRCYMPVAWHI